MSRHEQRSIVIQALRRALEKFRHYQSFSKRAKVFIQNELPDYTVYVYTSNERFGRNGVRVWGNGLNYEDAVDIGVDVNSKNWVQSFDEALDIADTSDYAERSKDEEQLIPILEGLEARVVAIQEEANALFERLPIPKSAKARASSIYWDGPSIEVRKRFPKLFP